MKIKEFLRLESAPKVIIYLPDFAKMLDNDVNAAIFLCQLIFWEGKQWDKENGWIRKSQAEMEDEICMKRSKQQSARRKLVERGFIQESQKGIPPTLKFKVNREKIIQEWDDYNASRIAEKSRNKSRIKSNINSNESADNNQQNQPYNEMESNTSIRRKIAK